LSQWDAMPMNSLAWMVNGMIDDVRIYNRALNPKDIAELAR